MSQVFAADGVSSQTSVNCPGTTATVVITSNFLNPPFGNAKAIVTAQVSVQPGTAATQIYLDIRRNPQSENVSIVGNQAVATVTPGNYNLLGVSGADRIPDGRAVQYGLVLTQAGATGAAIAFYQSLNVLLISG
jgi:hypothetical protein